MAKKNIGVVRFLGTNCDKDVFSAVRQAGLEPRWIWHQDQFEKNEFAALIIPGGFSYGDYLRCGALAARAPAMKSVTEAAKFGVPILGICNGFQILCEAHLLPGALLRNDSMRFRDTWVDLKLVHQQKTFGGKIKHVRLPIAHGEGRYYLEEDQVKRLFDDDQVWWTYEKNPNGSLENIAGVMNEAGNVAALMPHPERAVADYMGGTDGLAFFNCLLEM
jgi:phosphoribosylformylglycinamidine synthase